MGALDPATGRLVFRDCDVAISPTLTRSQFLASQTGAGSQIHVSNKPWCSWAFKAHDGEDLFSVAVYFLGEQLQNVDLSASSARFGTSWDDYTPERIDAQMAFHRAWLSERCGIGSSRVSWGSIWSAFDSRAGFADISIRYGEGGTPLVYGSMAEQDAAIDRELQKRQRDYEEVRLQARRVVVVVFILWVIIVGLIAVGILAGVRRAP